MPLVVPGEDVFEHGEDFVAHEGVVAGGEQVGARGDEKPERGVGGVVVGRCRRRRESGWAACLRLALGEGAEDFAGLGETPGGEAEAGQGDHGVAAPVAEPVVAGDDGVQVFAAADDELVGGAHELAFDFAGEARGGDDGLAPGGLGGEQRGADRARGV